MAEIVNLNRYRKARDKERAKTAAEENRARFGRNKAEKRADADAQERNTQKIDGAHLEDDGPEPA
jgi:hypothetical protein